MQPDNARNTIIFIVCTVAFLILYQVFVLQPAADRRQAAQAAAESQVASSVAADADATVGWPQTEIYTDRRTALATGARVPIATPTVQGSLSLRGARIDDLV